MDKAFVNLVSNNKGIGKGWLGTKIEALAWFAQNYYHQIRTCI